VMTHRQNLSSEVLLRTSEPSLGVSEAQPLTTKTGKSKTARKDSGPTPLGTFKPVAVPRTVVEDPPATSDWDSSDNTGPEVASQAKVAGKLDCSPKHQLRAVENDRSSTPGKKVRKERGRTSTISRKQRSKKVRWDSDRTPTAQRKQRRVTDRLEEHRDGSDSWDSTEESTPVPLSRPNAGSHRPAAAKSREDPDSRRTSDELADIDWSDSSSSSHQDFVEHTQ